MLDLEKDSIPGDPYHIRKLAVTPHNFADDAADALLDLKDALKSGEADVRRATHEIQRAKAHRATAERNVASTQSALDAAKMLTGQAKDLLEEVARLTVAKPGEASDADTPDHRLREGNGDWFTDGRGDLVRAVLDRLLVTKGPHHCGVTFKAPIEAVEDRASSPAVPP